MISATVKRKQLIKQWPNKLDDVNRQFLPSAGIVVEGDAKRRVPVMTGELRTSINTQVGSDQVIVGTNVNYATHVEYGTVKAKAQPFLRPALDNNRKKLVKLWKDIFRRVYG